MAEQKKPLYVSKVKLKHPLAVYELARTGMKLTPMAKQLHVTKNTLNVWLKEVPEIKEAFDRGRAESTAKESGTFYDYIANHLPEDLKLLWDQLEQANQNNDCGIETRQIMEKANLKKKQRQYLFLHALIASNFNINDACRKTATPVIIVKKWRKDPQFEAMAKQIHELRKDFVESALMGLVAQADTAAVIFANRTLNSDRGYNPKTTVEHTGNVDHTHMTLDQVLAMLPLKMQKEALKQLRKGQPAMLPVHQEVEVDPKEEDVLDVEYVVKGEEDE